MEVTTTYILKDWKFKDEKHGIIAIIQEVESLPFKGSKIREIGYKVVLQAAYDENDVYFVSIYETYKEAMGTIKKYASDCKEVK